MKWKEQFFSLIIFLLIPSNFLVWQEIFDFSKGLMNVVFFDVGQGDAIFIETPQGHQILIDGGPGKQILEKLNENIPFWDRTIDLIILTHPDADHLAGLNYVLQNYKVKNILWNGVKKETQTFKDWEKKLAKEKNKDKANIIIAQKGQKIKASDAEFYILYLFENLEGKIFKKNTNKDSIVSKLFFGKNTFLFTADIDQKTEKQFLEEKINLNAQVLKVAHHGSKISCFEEFLKEVSPDFAVISSGKNNPYHFPNQETLEKLQNIGAKILRTDQKGDIKMVSDGINLKILNQK
ncbi:MBL fold metallo-hydrolase [Patescibacteria group bacterium]|nr:MBL fold metallo-hydrolase [Patescibacteria group bacterium]